MINIEWDIKENVKALLTKADIQQLIATVEKSCKQAVEELGEEVVAVGNRVEAIENGQEEIIQAVADVQDTTKYCEEIINN